MKYKGSKRFFSVIALITAVSMMAAGCSSDGQESAEGSVTSINVIGGSSAESENSGTDADNTADAGTDVQESGAAVTTVPTEIVTDDSGNTVTGANGEAMTQPVQTEIDPSMTLSEEDILAAMTTTQRQEINIDRYTGKRYAYDTLSADEKKLYDDIKSGIENLRYKIAGEDDYSLEEWAKIYGLVYSQEPQLFYMGPKVKVGKLFYITKDTEVINSMQKEIDATADKLVSQAAGKSTFDQLKIFHDYLVLNSTFELKDDMLADYNSSIYNALGHSDGEQGNIQCAGYAKAMQYLCDKAGITCMVVTGENNEGATHAWNVVDVDGEWYNLDCTWDDPVLETPNPKNLRYKYFLIPDSWIHNISHMHVSQRCLSNGDYITYYTPPACTSTAQNYFVKNGLVYSDFASADKAIKDEIKKAAENKSRSAHIMVASKDLYDEMYAARMDYNNYAKGFDGVKGVNDECNENMLILEFDVIYK